MLWTVPVHESCLHSARVMFTQYTELCVYFCVHVVHTWLDYCTYRTWHFINFKKLFFPSLLHPPYMQGHSRWVNKTLFLDGCSKKLLYAYYQEYVSVMDLVCLRNESWEKRWASESSLRSEKNLWNQWNAAEMCRATAQESCSLLLKLNDRRCSEAVAYP